MAKRKPSELVKTLEEIRPGENLPKGFMGDDVIREHAKVVTTKRMRDKRRKKRKAKKRAKR